MDGDTEIPPLVTAESIARAKEMFQGSPIQFQPVRPQQYQKPRAAKLANQFSAPKHVTMLAEPPSAFAGIPPVVFVLTFFGSVGAIVIMFAVAERSKLVTVLSNNVSILFSISFVYDLRSQFEICVSQCGPGGKKARPEWFFRNAYQFSISQATLAFLSLFEVNRAKNLGFWGCDSAWPLCPFLPKIP